MQTNVLAVLVAAFSSFLLGGIWYSPVLFGKRWQREAGDTHKPGQGHPARVFALSFVFALLGAFAFALLLPHPSDAVHAGAQGLMVGAGLVATSFGINYQFANRSILMWLIDGGYHTVQFGIYGLILGVWR
jgi:hypothetical protein